MKRTFTFALIFSTLLIGRETRSTVQKCSKGDNFAQTVIRALHAITPQTFDRIMTKIFLLYEAAATAAGTRILQLNETAEADRRHRVVGASAFELWLHLPTVDKVNEIFTNVVTYALSEKHGGAVESSSSFDEIFSRADKLLEGDGTIGEKYKNVKRRVASEIVSRADHFDKTTRNLSTLGTDILNSGDPLPKMAFVHFKLMYAYANRTNPKENAQKYEYFVTTKSIVELSKNPEYTDRVQQLYNETLVELAETFRSVAEKGAERRFQQNRDEDTDQILFDSLTKKFENDDLLEIEFYLLRKSISAYCGHGAS